MTIAAADLWVDETLDPRRTLARAEAAVAQRRSGELLELMTCLDWADLHACDPRDEPGWEAFPGGEELVQLGGEGTPMVRDLALLELGTALCRHPLGVRAMTADALDLRHRLPQVWRHLLDGEADAWVARRVASLSRVVPRKDVAVVDAVVAAAIIGTAPSRLIEIAEAAVVEADPAGHLLRTEKERARRYVGLARADSSGVRTLVARLRNADAIWLDGVVDRIADVLAAQQDVPEVHDQGTYVQRTRDQLRADALGLLARPAEVLALLAGEPADQEWTPPAPDDPWIPESSVEPEDPEVPADAPTADPTRSYGDADEPVTEAVPEHVADKPSRAFALAADVLDRLTPDLLDRLRPTATLYVHLHEAAVRTAVGVVRTEGLPPLEVAQLADLLGHHRVTVKPVIDTTEHHAVDAYEHPAWMRERIHLTTPAEVFPHASRRGRHVDLDHPIPWVHPDHGGPPGQTSTESQPLSRTTHRARTHLGYTIVRTPAGVVWRTPHGLHRLVDPSGVTHRITVDEADVLVHGEDGVDRFLRRLLPD